MFSILFADNVFNFIGAGGLSAPYPLEPPISRLLSPLLVHYCYIY